MTCMLCCSQKDLICKDATFIVAVYATLFQYPIQARMSGDFDYAGTRLSQYQDTRLAKTHSGRVWFAKTWSVQKDVIHFIKAPLGLHSLNESASKCT